DVRVDLLAHQRAPLPEVKGAGGRDAHFRKDPAMCFQKLEMFDLRMTDEIHLSRNLYCFVLCLDTVKLNACGSGDRFDTFETAEKIEMPPGAAEFTAGGDLNSDVFHLPDDLLVLAVFDGRQHSGIDFVPRALGARFLQRC